MTSFPDPAESLAALLEGAEPPWDETPEAPPDADRADSMLRRLARLQLEQHRIDEQRRRLIATANEWADHELNTREAQVAWLKASLGGYLRGIYERTGTMSLRLPAGQLTSRKAREEWVIVDEPALLAWAAEHLPKVIRQPAPELDRNALKAELTQRDEQGRPIAFGITADGEVAPGLRVDLGERHFDARPNFEEHE
jgi:hypothetical protein